MIGKNKKTFSGTPLPLDIFHWNFLKSCQVFYLPVLSNCIFVNGKQPCSPSWCFRTMSMTSCNGSIVHLPLRLLDLLLCCSLQMWAQRWIYRARRIQWSTEVSSKNLPECKKLPFHDRTGTKNVSHEVKLGQRSLMKGLPQTLVQNFQFEYLEGPQLPFR